LGFLPYEEWSALVSEATRFADDLTPTSWLGTSGNAAAATKWVGFLALVGVAGLSMLWAASRQAIEPLRKRIGAAARHEGWKLIVAIVIAPLVVYVVSFVGTIDGPVLSWPWAHEGTSWVSRRRCCSSISGSRM
jgi:hypothetical protein